MNFFNIMKKIILIIIISLLFGYSVFNYTKADKNNEFILGSATTTTEIVSTTYYADENLVHYWRFEDEHDSIGGRDLTNTTNVTFTDGVFGNAADFGSNSDKCLTYPDYMVGATADVSINFWFLLYSQPSGEKNILFHDVYYDSQPTSFTYMSYGYNNEHYGLQYGTGYPSRGESIIFMDEVIPNDTWHMATFVLDKNNLTLYAYFDGELVGTTTDTVIDNGSVDDSVFWIGCGRTYRDILEGKIDDFAIFDDVLTAEEIENIYNYSTSSTPIVEEEEATSTPIVATSSNKKQTKKIYKGKFIFGSNVTLK